MLKDGYLLASVARLMITYVLLYANQVQNIFIYLVYGRGYVCDCLLTVSEKLLSWLTLELAAADTATIADSKSSSAQCPGLLPLSTRSTCEVRGIVSFDW